MITLQDIPAIDASLNAVSAGFLLLGWWQIKHERKLWHIGAMSCALVSSTAFLACYLTYHFQAGVGTHYSGQGFGRTAYFAMLISHVLLAFATVPLVLATVTAALRGRYEIHRRRARWTLPIWLYVSVTGVLIYLVLYGI